MESGNTGKYLGYAVGEILLVSIGILLALQVNNWNEARLTKLEEFRIVEDLVATTQSDLERNQYQLRRNKNSMQSLEYVISHMEGNQAYHDSLDFHFANAHNRWVAIIATNAYQRAKEFGIGFLPDSIRSHLESIYEFSLDYLHKLEDRNTLFYYQIVMPKTTKVFHATFPQGRHWEDMKPINYDALRRDQEFKTILNSIKAHKSQYVEWQEFAVLNSISVLNEGLKVYLERTKV